MRGAENQRLADAITKTGNLGPLPIYVGEVAHGREKGRDEIVDLFRRVAAHGEDVAERLHSALKGHVDPDLHRTLYAESQIPEPDGGKDGDDEEENPDTPKIPPTKPGDTPKPKPPGESDDPDDGEDKDEDEEKEKLCVALREELKEVELSLEIANGELRDLSERLRKISEDLPEARRQKNRALLVAAVQLLVPETRILAAIKAGANVVVRVIRGVQEKVPIPDSVSDAVRHYLKLDEDGERIRKRFDAVDAEIQDLKDQAKSIRSEMESNGCR